MAVHIRSAFATITLQSWYETDGDVVARTTLGVTELRLLIASEHGVSQALRQLVVDVDGHGSGLEWCSDEELLQRLARLIERGLICARSSEPYSPIYTEPAEEPRTPQRDVEPLEPMAPLEQALHWIEVQLLGEDDEAISNTRCQIVLPNGKAIVRTTDRFGLVRIDGVEDAGSCQISFPDLDSEAWEAL